MSVNLSYRLSFGYDWANAELERAEGHEATNNINSRHFYGDTLNGKIGRRGFLPKKSIGVEKSRLSRKVTFWETGRGSKYFPRVHEDQPYRGVVC